MRRGLLPMGRTGSSSKGWSLTNWRVLSGRWSELLMFCRRMRLLIHWWKKATHSLLYYSVFHISSVLFISSIRVDELIFIPKSGLSGSKAPQNWFIMKTVLCLKYLLLQDVEMEWCHCTAPTWCGTAPLWPSACTFPWRTHLPLMSGCRHKQLTIPHCPWWVKMYKRG